MWRKRQDPLEWVNVLELEPVRAAEFEDDGDRVVVIRPAPTTRGLRGTIDRLLYELSARRIRLDELSTFVWRHLDGERTVVEIARLMRDQFGDRVEPAEERVGKLVQVMYREGFVAYRGVP